jgi:hypothetical protein
MAVLCLIPVMPTGTGRGIKAFSSFTTPVHRTLISTEGEKDKVGKRGYKEKPFPERNAMPAN